MSIWLAIVLIVVLLALNAFFVAAEFALVTVDRGQVDRAAAEGDAAAGGVQSALRSLLSLIHISEPTRPVCSSRMPSSA